MKTIIDTHTYIGKNPALGLESQPNQFSELQAQVQKQGMNIKFLLMTYSRESNFDLSKIIEENPTLFLGGILQINPNESYQKISGYTSPKEIEKLIKSGQIVALKHNTFGSKTRIDCDSLDDFSKIAVEYDLPLITHCSATGQDFTHPDFFIRLRDKNPDLTIVCAHYGGLEETYMPAYVELVKNDSKMFLNTTGLSGDIKRWNDSTNPPTHYFEKNKHRWTDIFRETIEQISDKVIFGSDYPELKFNLHPINLVDKDIQQKVLYNNAIKIFKLNDY